MTYLLQATIPYYTNLPKDVITNTFHFNWTGAGDPDDADFGLLADSVANFYETLYPVGGTSDLAPFVDKTKYRTKIYDLVLPKPRVPVFERVETLAVDVAANSNIPAEVSLCISYYATPVSGISPASMRGRIYLGGLSNTIGNAATTNSFPVPSTAFTTLCINAAKGLVNNEPTSHFQWVVYSEKLGVPHPIVGGWVDNAFDTQRRRGQAATARTMWVP